MRDTLEATTQQRESHREQNFTQNLNTQDKITGEAGQAYNVGWKTDCGVTRPDPFQSY